VTDRQSYGKPPFCDDDDVSRTLITGMSATGKSTTIARLAGLGHHAVDLDLAEWSALVPDYSTYAERDGALDWRWRQPAVRDLLLGVADDRDLYVAGTSTHQSELYSLLEHIVVLTVPEAVARDRLATRTTNDYGKDPAELDRELELRGRVEPRLLAGACLVIDTSAAAADDVARTIVEHALTTHDVRDRA
jgi:energy-coupling factor transporter ATP-binding protein EcfA2